MLPVDFHGGALLPPVCGNIGILYVSLVSYVSISFINGLDLSIMRARTPASLNSLL